MARSHGIDGEARRTQGAVKGPWFYEMEELGYNYRLSDISCTLGLSQLKKLPEYLSRRREIARMYDAAFADIPGLTLPARRRGADSSWHLYVIRATRDKFTAGRREIFDALKAENIGVNVHYIPVHLHPYYRQQFGYEGGEYPIAENAYEEMITLPLFPAMTGQDVADVVAAVDKVLTHFSKPAAGGDS
jgi:dTDP-4-amino-4,6-dideoxygalactose transaminase